MPNFGSPGGAGGAGWVHGVDSAGGAIPSVAVTAEFDDTSTDLATENQLSTLRFMSTARDLAVSLYTKIAGEDLTNNVMKTESQYSGTYATADAQIKGAAGFLHSVTFMCTDAAPTAGSIIIYDSLTEANTIILSITFTTTPFVAFTVVLDRICTTGIYAGFTTTTDVGIQLTWR